MKPGPYLLPALQFPQTGGVYAVYDNSGTLHYLGISRRASPRLLQLLLLLLLRPPACRCSCARLPAAAPVPACLPLLPCPPAAAAAGPRLPAAAAVSTCLPLTVLWTAVLA